MLNALAVSVNTQRSNVLTLLCAESHAQDIVDNIADLAAAPLRSTRSFVLDVGKKGKDRSARPPQITVLPPLNAGSARPDPKKKIRRPNDRKELTAHGRAALSRSKGSRGSGELCKTSVVWKLEYRCAGTHLCDSKGLQSCAVRLVFTATVEQVANNLVHVEVHGHGAHTLVSSRAGTDSLHSVLCWVQHMK